MRVLKIVGLMSVAEVEQGASIRAVAKEAVQRVESLGIPMTFEFNALDYIIRPGDTVDEFLGKWDATRKELGRSSLCP